MKQDGPDQEKVEKGVLDGKEYRRCRCQCQYSQYRAANLFLELACCALSRYGCVCRDMGALRDLLEQVRDMKALRRHLGHSF